MFVCVRWRLTCWTAVAGLWLVAAVPAFADTYELDPASAITYHVVHPMHAVEGVNRAVTGASIAFDVTRPADVTGILKRPIFAWWEEFDSGNANRDANALVHVEADRYPRVVFVPQRFADVSVTGGTAHGTVIGALYVKGQRRLVSAPIRVRPRAGGAVLDVWGSFETAFSEFEIERPSLLMVKTRDPIRVEFHLIYRRTPP